MRRLSLIVVLLFVVPAVALEADEPDKIRVDDGSTVIDVGELQCHIANWGLIGSHYTAEHFPYHTAPSCRWPGPDGRQHLYGGGLLVGAWVGSLAHVTMAQPASEFLPDPDPAVVPLTSYAGDPGRARYPDPDADDDGDGLIDEDPLDGRDNDDDGLVDEDYAAWGDQYLRCEYTDPAQQPYPAHFPLGIRVVVEACQWTDPEHGSAIGLQYTVHNEGEHLLERVYCGFYSDPDVAATDAAGENEDDRAGCFVGEIDPGDGDPVPITVLYAYDGKPGAESGYLGQLLLGKRIGDEEGAFQLPAPGRANRILTRVQQFGFYQLPLTDHAVYGMLDHQRTDTSTLSAWDYRLLTSAGPYGDLAPGESLTVRFAYVAAASLSELLVRAARIRRTYQGAAFDRDGDPANGAEHVVRWLRPQDVPVAAATGRLAVAAAAADRVLLALDTNLESLDGLTLERETDAGILRWPAARLAVGGALLDTEPGAWPRTYRLLTDAGAVLHELSLAAPRLAAPELELFAAPNPFNPSLTVEYRLAAPAEAVLSVYDLAGRLVARLDEGPRAAGLHTARWDGRTPDGRAAPSGAYHLRLEADGTVTARTVSLVR